ncbi:carboxypeptidase-like regulatory domain-containing protein [Cellulosimicrobium marinum]|uniref:carboxypeptidase-like regulatory domain-containing protein n=1 Tax=Cellulosimicrobium marinum TaxID=1638992 RepID=UPI001E2A9D4F|nr:carboxypeptidase-like regulatory domain-containing protein [Cellulosimicrobium marinum]MCB7137185.1 carboxypeptidase-like regulatory domain-containing protein [Cellulosimicrobium marinum]
MTLTHRRAPHVLLTALVALVLAVGLVPLGAPEADAATRYRISTWVSTTRVLGGEAVWVKGTVTDSRGKPVDGVTVALQRRPSGGSWSTFAYRTTGASGVGLYPNRPGRSYHYRAVIKGNSKVVQVYGAAKTVRLLPSGTRSLGYRAQQLAPVIGRATSHMATSGSTAWQYYSGGLLVRRGDTGSQRTWLVQGKMLTAYKNAGGLKGPLGRPLQDIRCSLLESGCIQRFVGGTLYYSSTSPTVTIAYGSGKWTEHAAVAKSQVGYEEPTWRVNKYNTWVGARNAWCGVFQSWASAASGNGSAVPKATTFTGLVSAVKSRGMTRSTPAVGRLAFFDFNPNDGVRSPTHTGYIVEVRSGSSIVTIEGNTTYSGGFTNERVVAQRVRPTSAVVFYAAPY